MPSRDQDESGLWLDRSGKVVLGSYNGPTSAGESVNTFLPYPDYTLSAAVLDDKRLGKQRVEVLQILNTLHEIPTESGKPRGWSNHPAVRMWRGCELQLCEYGLVITEEWKRRGFKDTCYNKIRQHLDWAEGGNMLKPIWFGDVDFHDSHKSNLLRKDPDHYGKFFQHVPADLPYIWPEP